MQRLVLTMAASIASLTMTSPICAQSVAEFYAGKTVQMGVGYPSGGFDAYTRALARSIGKYIPGHPTVIVVNMPGASSFVYARHLQTRARKDGTEFGMFDRGLIAKSLIEPQSVNLDFRKFAWVGSMNRETSACVMGNQKHVVAVSDLVKHQGDVVLGGVSRDGGGYVYTTLLQRMSPKNVRQVFGYGSTSDMVLAIERGELDGSCFIYGTLKVNYPDQLASGKLRAILQFSDSRSQDLPNVPTAYDVVTDEVDRKVIKFLASPDVVGRPIVGPIDIPSDRVAALRKAFDETVKDADFLDFTSKARMDMDAISGADSAKIVDDIYSTSPDIIERARKILE